MTTAEVGRRRVLVFALLIAIAFGGISFWSWWGDREELRSGSKVVAQGGDPLEIDDIPTTYRAVYRYENRAGGKLVLTSEKVWVRRPFAARIESYAGPVARGRPTTLRQSVFGTLVNDSEGTAEPLNIAVPPSIASGDLRPDVIIEEALESRQLFIREQREIIGRRCQVYRAGSSMLAGDVPRFEAGSGDYADVCIDKHGIVLEEYWVQDDRPIRRRIATQLDVDIPLDRTLFTIEVPETPGIKRGVVSRLTKPQKDVGPLWTLPKAPKGFDKLGRYAVVIAADAVPNPTGGTPPPPPTSTSDVYVRGPDLVVVDQDPSLAGLIGFEGRPTQDIELENLENGKLIVDARMTEVRGVAEDGSVVRVLGTLPSDELIALANRLKPQE
jgi:hypothetical protein